ncbi:hypothetical protein NIES4072_18590 [Nostoc commune NIES-4072]|uniref:Uncharacterized protein n=1 Tax=Nostoc commune NIES-4072 TaxID=2005467 RepID=A0A2R5FIV4_NOSCO|nr:hypothetical protein [Nostoc commune]BBD64479.1 hypothetical protein NIES4070_08220 [Nostoc commune HK-02]GBG18195.1 hypothetical protein NIES4072_18590 [Nostoc commune NIES-4072]
MVIRLPGVNYIPKVQLASIKVNVDNSLVVLPAGVKLLSGGDVTTAPITFVGVNVDLVITDIEKAKVSAIIARLFDQINKMANGNQPETPPRDEPILQGRVGGDAMTEIEISVDESENIPVCSVILKISSMRFDLLESKLAEIFSYITSTISSDL